MWLLLFGTGPIRFWRRWRKKIRTARKKKKLKTQALQGGWATHNLCHLFSSCWMASSSRPSVHSPVHRQHFSKLVPPCTTVLKTHTVADGLSSVEAVMTQFRHDRLWRMSSTRETSSASNNYRADSLNHRLMKSSCASARSLQASLVCSERSVTRRNETLVSFKKTEPKGSKAFLMWPLLSRSLKI